MNQTIWISPQGQIINCPPNAHYDYINQNFSHLFGRQPLNEAEVHDEPYTKGWVHIQNHFGTFNIRGSQQGIVTKKRAIRDLIFERLMTDRHFTVNIEYNNKAMINPYGTRYSFNMPNQYDELKHYLS